MTSRSHPSQPGTTAPQFGQPSASARHVARIRSRLSRPVTPTGDADAEARLYASLDESTAFDRFIAARTEFFDAELLRALRMPACQVVILGAGYDGRALRFRTPGVTFYEADLPWTQADKRRRLAAVQAVATDVRFVEADFTEGWLPGLLQARGFDRGQRSVFLCEGVLLYLPRPAIVRLLEGVRAVAAAGSPLVTSFAMAGPRTSAADDKAPAADPPREHRQSFYTPDAALELLEACGWRVETSQNPTPRRTAAEDIALFVRSVPA